MKRSVINLFAIVVILASLIGSSIQATPVEALGSMVNVELTKPALGWKNGYLYGIWGSHTGNVFAAGSGNSQSHEAEMPMIYRGSGTDTTGWTAFSSSELSLPSGWSSGTLMDVWGISDTDVYAVGYGYNGTTTMPLLYHYNGTTWNYDSTIALPTPPAPAPAWSYGRLYSVWGTDDGSNIYIVGMGDSGPRNMPLLYHYYDSSWHWESLDIDPSWMEGLISDIWGSPNGHIYAVGYGNSGGTTVPLLYHYDGINWNWSSPDLPGGWTTGYIRALWGSANDDIYAVGGGGPGDITLPLLYHSSDGTSWSASGLTLPTNLGAGDLYDIWGASGNDVYAVGSGNESGTLVPLLYRKAGTNWGASTSLPDGTATGSFEGIWGSSADDVYAVGKATGGTWGNITPLLSHAGIDLKKPSTVTSLTASPGRLNGTVKLTWYAPFDDFDNPYSGPVDSYIIKQSKSPVSDCSGGTVANVTPVQPGQLQAMRVSNLDAGVKYYFAICARDELPSQNLGDPQTSSAVANVGNLVPEAVTLVAPSGSSVFYQPTYTWNADLFASWYFLWVNGPSGNIIQKWYSSTQANCNSTTCSILSPMTLSSGTYTWWVQTWNDVGTGPWSASKSFTLPRPPLPGQATAALPTNTIAINNPTYTWSKVPYATWYYLWVNGPSGNVISKWYTTDQANCSASTCSVAGATPGLAVGSYNWSVQTWNETGTGPWSNTQSFNLAPPGQAILSLPDGPAGTNNPIYTWSDVPGSSWYYLSVNGPSGNVIQKWYSSAQAGCDGVQCSVAANVKLRSGAYTWWIQTWNDLGTGPWSAGKNFSVPVPPLPGKVTASLPTGATETNNPIYVWNDDPSATFYYLWVKSSSSDVIQKWYSSLEAGCNGTTCSLANATPGLVVGSYSWSVRAWNDAGFGGWSDSLAFNPVIPQKTTPSLPSGVISTNSPTYSWDDVPYATSYFLFVNGPSGNVLQKWYSPEQAGCDGTTCSVAGATPSLVAGSYNWSVRTWNSVGYGPWSNTQNFSFAIPGKAAESSPTGTIATNNPTYIWSDVPGSSWYYLSVNGPSGNVLKKWYSSSQVSCNGTTCSLADATPGLASGAHIWWVQTWNDLGNGPWSDGMNFVVP